MKKIFSFLVFLCACLVTAYGQFYVSGNNFTIDNPNGLNNVYIFKDLQGAEFRYDTIVNANVVWKKYSASQADAVIVQSDNNTMSSIFMPHNDTKAGYILEVDGVVTQKIYVFDYSQYQPSFGSIDAVANCDETNITVNFAALPQALTYYKLNNNPANGYTALERTFELTYRTLTWNAGNRSFDEVEAEPIVFNPGNYLSITRSTDSMYINTTFVVKEVNRATDAFSLNYSFESPEFEAVKPVIRAEGILTVRDALNEMDKGSEEERKSLEGSAPMEVSLESFKGPIGMNPIWTVYEIDSDNPGQLFPVESFQYVFSHMGKFVARVDTETGPLTIDPDGCKAKDSITVEVSLSELEVPNVFTPNGDGKNDRFCVAYKSIVEFKMWVYNRWGRQVFYANNAANCWDGYIGNAKAATGAYFYVIEAKGADNKKYKLSGDINLLR